MKRVSKRELARLRRDVPLLHVLYAFELKAKELESLGALDPRVTPARLLEGFGSWAALFVLRELAACGDEQAKRWADDLEKSRNNYRKSVTKRRKVR